MLKKSMLLIISLIIIPKYVLADLFISTTMSALYTKHEDKIMHLTVPEGSKEITTVPVSDPTHHVPDHLSPGHYTGKIQGKEIIGAGSSLGIGYAVGSTVGSSVSLNIGYDWFGTHKATDMDSTISTDNAEVYDETAIYGTIRATLPLIHIHNISPYMALEGGIAYRTVNDTDMDDDLRQIPMCKIDPVTSIGPNNCNIVGVTKSSALGHSACPGYGNFKSGDKKRDYTYIIGSGIGIQYLMDTHMLLAIEYLIHFNLKKTKFEDKKNSTSYIEGDHIKQRITINVKYNF